MAERTREARQLGSVISVTRQRIGLTQGDLAERVTMDQGLLSKIESGTKEPSLAVFRRIALALGAQPGDLLNQAWQPREVSRVG